MDLFEQDLLDQKKQALDAEFQAAIQNSAQEHATYRFWFKAVCLTHPDGKGGNWLPHWVFVELTNYYKELTDWLELNYPSNHWRPVGIYKREDFILSAH